MIEVRELEIQPSFLRENLVSLNIIKDPNIDK